MSNNAKGSSAYNAGSTPPVLPGAGSTNSGNQTSHFENSDQYTKDIADAMNFCVKLNIPWSGTVSDMFRLFCAGRHGIQPGTKLICPDGGTCHHFCEEPCARRDILGCVPLTISGLNDDWTKP